MTDESVGERIRRLRQEQERSQAELTKSGLLSASYLSLIEAGQRRPSPEVLRHLAQALGTTPEYLATGRPSDIWQEAERRLAFAELALHHASPGEALAEFEGVLETGPAPLRSRAELGRARALELLDRTEEAAAPFEALMQAAEPGTAAWAERAVDVMRCHKRLGDHAYAIDLGERAMTVFENLALEWSDSSVRLGVTLAGVYQRRGDLAHAARMLRRLIEIADGVGSPLARGSAYWNAAGVAQLQGRLADARLLADRALALFGETDHHRNLAMLRGFYGWLLLKGEPSEPERAREVLLEASRQLSQLATPAETSSCEVGAARATLRLGNLDEARALAQSACDRVAGTGAPSSRAEALITLATVQLAAGDADQADTTFADGERALEQAPPERLVVDLWNELATIHEERGDTTSALRAYRHALKAAGYQPTRSSAPSKQPP